MAITLEQKIEQTRGKILVLQRDLATLEAAKALLEADALPATVVQPVQEENSHKRHRRSDHPRRGVLSPSGDAGRAWKVLTDAGKGLHVDRIAENMEAAFGVRPQRASLIGALSRYAKRGEHFRRMEEPNTFRAI